MAAHMPPDYVSEAMKRFHAALNDELLSASIAGKDLWVSEPKWVRTDEHAYRIEWEFQRVDPGIRCGPSSGSVYQTSILPHQSSDK